VITEQEMKAHVARIDGHAREWRRMTVVGCIIAA